jgi:hypothetical protein
LTSNLLFMNGAEDGRGSGLPLTVATYAALFLAGAVEGLFGSFQYSRAAPAGAIGFGLLLLASGLVAAWAMRSVSGALAVAAGWLLASFLLSMPVAGGSVIIANTAAGKWYLYGGTAAAIAAVLGPFIVSMRRLAGAAHGARRP